MKKRFSQLELIELLESNPLHVPVYFNEVTIENASNYIFLYNTSDQAIKHDNVADYVNDVQIQIYCESIDDMNVLVHFLNENFIGNKQKYKDNDFNVTTLTCQLVVDEWI